ncbi:hypothetical protein CYCD_21580 [Tenuifilaceae bacterium CYCD]|nr:hypothetical protein CYCD_21580 [Tenuifilaceae bacterium CYCD]
MAQTEEHGWICFYYTNQIGHRPSFTISLNDNEVFNLEMRARVRYKIFSTGDIKISCYDNKHGMGNSITLNVQHGKTYYVKLDHVSLKLKQVEEKIGENEFNNQRLAEIQKITEDKQNLVIKKEKPIINTSNTQIAKVEVKSDVDINIPIDGAVKNNTYALIIGNEDYSSNQTDISTEVNVQFAENDAKIFKEYCVKTLGIPEKNATLLINATGSRILQNLDLLSKISKANGGDAELVFYYAGHGLPDEQTKEPYLIPVDVSGADLKYAIKLAEVYKKLTENPSAKVTVFIDACFSGGARNESLLALRGVKVRPKEVAVGNNLVVFTSSSGNESSASYKDKQHGMFTYYLLKKLQDSKGNCTYKELDEYLKKEVSINSLVINKKQQTPQAMGSPDVDEKWRNWKIK